MLVALFAFQATSVAFAAPTDTAARVLPKLGEAMGLRLEADRRARDQILLIRVAGIDRNRLLSLVAQTTGGEWERIDGGYRLVLGSTQTQALWKEEDAARQAWIERAVADAAQGWSPSSRPTDRTALIALVRAIGAPAIARIRPGTRKLWSTRPSADDQTLPAGTAKIARELIDATTRRLEELQRRGVDVPVGAIDRFQRAPATMLFAARQGRSSDGVGLSFLVRAADGSAIVQAAARIVAPIPAPDGAVVDRLPSSPRPFSADVRSWAAVLAGSATPGKATYDRFAHPETFEPLGLAIGPGIEATAQALGANVVACLPDSLYRPEMGRAMADGLGRRWPHELAKHGLDLRLENGVLVGQPRQRGSGTEERTDRALLRRRIGDVERDAHLNFQYAEPYGLAYAHLVSLPANLYEDLYFSEWPWGPPLAWNGLTPAQRSRALSSGLPLREAPRFAAQYLQGWEPFAVRDADESLSELETNQPVRIALREGRLRAKIDETPMVVVKTSDRLLPEALDYETVARRLSASGPRDALRSEDAAFYPALRREVTLFIEAPNRTDLRVEFPFRLVFRTRDVPARYPTLFPGLRRAIEQAPPAP